MIEKRRRQEEGGPGGGEAGRDEGHPWARHRDHQAIGGQSATDGGGGSNPYGADAILTPASARILYGLYPPFARVPAQVQSLIMDIHVNHLAPATTGCETSLVDEASLFA